MVDVYYVNVCIYITYTANVVILTVEAAHDNTRHRDSDATDC